MEYHVYLLHRLSCKVEITDSNHGACGYAVTDVILLVRIPEIEQNRTVILCMPVLHKFSRVE